MLLALQVVRWPLPPGGLSEVPSLPHPVPLACRAEAVQLAHRCLRGNALNIGVPSPCSGEGAGSGHLCHSGLAF